MKESIKKSIQNFENNNVTENSLAFFNTLGYDTTLTITQDQKTYQNFKENFVDLSENKNQYNETKALTNHWKTFDFLFQLTDELTGLKGGKVGDQISNSVIFACIELSENNYSRTQLAEVTRQVNVIFKIPVVLLFKYENKLTLSVIHRRINKKDEQKDVLEKVSFIKDISINNPHRAQIDILFDFALPNLDKKKPSNFVELINAWEKVFSTKELNKNFYKELFNWYLWAVQKVQFPKPENDTTENKTYQSQAVIRLITRLIFVWFLKEKKLIPSKTFEIDYLKNLLNDFKFNSKTSGSFYNAILQNLFFTTLNSPLNKDAKDDYEIRKFIDDESRHPKNTDVYNDQTKYRGKELFKNPEKLVELFSNIPFLNGGLFECLDRKEERQDGFSSNANKRAFVPNILFFGNETADLSKEMKDKKAEKTPVKGIISILNDYKFTIEENTPLEEDIALDPELLGKVFENLLASYNPETKDSVTARKQTGSFYTPREIVDYMVNESLLAYMQNYFPDLQSFEKLSILNEDEKYIFVKKLTDIKILDPACGSGAYPMGVLHKMVELIKTIDQKNLLLKEIQKNRIIGDKVAELLNDKEQIKNLSDDDVREKSLKAVEDRLQNLEEIFGKEYHDSNYLRKLFLIEYCIFGVDIQTIAIQISKLRFFISLLIDQKIDESQPNRGILSMPNLETKFVAANTLIGLETSKNGQIKAESEEVLKIEKELDEIRHKIFYLKRFSDKKKLKIKEAEKREELKKALIDSGLGEATATQKAEWNPFDILHTAPFFDAKTMFGLNANQSNKLIIQLNKQIDAINKQIDTINHSLKINLHKVVKLQTQVIDNQLDVIQIEIEYIAKRISKIYGEINQEVKDIVSEPKNYDYELYPVKTKIDTINQQLQELKSSLSTSPSMGVFDVVIGNPPYVDYRNINTDLKLYLKNYKISNYSSMINLYNYFFESSFNLLIVNGVLSFITPQQYLILENCKGVRDLIRENSVLHLSDFARVKVFDASTYAFVSIFKKGVNNKNGIYSEFDTIEDFTKPIKKAEVLNPLMEPFSSSKYLYLLNKLENLNADKLGKHIEIFCASSSTHIKSIQKLKNSFYFLQASDIFDYKIELKECFISKDGYSSNSLNKQMNEVIYTSRMTNKIRATIIKDKTILGGKVNVLYSINEYIKNEFILSLLNSKLINFWYREKYNIQHMQGGALPINTTEISLIPLPNIPENQQPLITLVNQILEGKKTAQDTSGLEHQIDVMVYHLYGLSYEEACVIDKELKKEDFEKYKM